MYPKEDSRKTGVNLYPLHGGIVRDYRLILWTLLAAVGVMLAVGCGNLANVVMVRDVARIPELTLRISLGASRRRIMRQLAVEAAVLAALGAVIGVALANFGLDVWRAFGPLASRVWTKWQWIGRCLRSPSLFQSWLQSHVVFSPPDS
jgi:hypothetical protein